VKRSIFIALYFSVIILILSLNQTEWFKDGARSKPLLNQAEASIDVRILTPYKRDPDLKKSWALKDNKAMSIHKAWKLSTCSKKIVIAIIDTGVDYNHPDLRANLWKNKKEIALNGKDDDGNGFIDDVIGWDFVSDDPLPYDNHGHGTHIAGIIGAVGGNGIGLVGVCHRTSLMILKYYEASADGKTNLDNTIKAFHYAINNGADIINYSGGGPEFSERERNAILAAQKKGILVVAAAGNERQNADIHAYYPASYNLSNILSVAAISESNELVSSSNFGVKKIDIAAPGESIYSTIPPALGSYGYMTGTSQATAFVTGIAAMALSKKRDLTPPGP